ncbi:MAG: hypothetical protein EZS28_011264, partial [Streblomastix strix]
LCVPFTRRRTFLSGSLDASIVLWDFEQSLPLAVMNLVEPIVSGSFYTQGAKRRPDEGLIIGFNSSITRIPFPLEPEEWRFADKLRMQHGLEADDAQDAYEKYQARQKQISLLREKTGIASDAILKKNETKSANESAIIMEKMIEINDTTGQASPRTIEMRRQKQLQEALDDALDEDFGLTPDQLKLKKKLTRLRTGKVSQNADVLGSLELFQAQEEKRKERVDSLNKAYRMTDKYLQKEVQRQVEDEIKKEPYHKPNDEDDDEAYRLQEEHEMAIRQRIIPKNENVQQKIQRIRKKQQIYEELHPVQESKFTRDKVLVFRTKSIFRPIDPEPIKPGDWKGLVAARQRLLEEIRARAEKENQRKNQDQDQIKDVSIMQLLFTGPRRIKNNKERVQFIKRLNEFTMIGDDKEEDVPNHYFIENAMGELKNEEDDNDRDVFIIDDEDEKKNEKEENERDNILDELGIDTMNKKKRRKNRKQQKTEVITPVIGESVTLVGSNAAF